MMNEITTVDPTTGEIEVFTPTGSFDPVRFEAVTNWAVMMAKASIIPQHLKGQTPEETLGNCFLVANQAATWGADPVSVAQCTSLVHGKLCYEGKLVDSILQERYGIKLYARYEGERGTDGHTIYLSPTQWNGTDTESSEIMEGTFKDWCTKEKDKTKVNQAWVKDPAGMLYNRGVRQWCRRYKPGIITGVYGADEFDEQVANYRAEQAKNVTPADNPFRDDKSPTVVEGEKKPAETKKPAADADLLTRRALLDKFHEALSDAGSAMALRTKQSEFFDEHDAVLIPQHAMQPWRDLYAMHQDRIKGELTPAAMTKSLTAIKASVR